MYLKKSWDYGITPRPVRTGVKGLTKGRERSKREGKTGGMEKRDRKNKKEINSQANARRKGGRKRAGSVREWETSQAGTYDGCRVTKKEIVFK